MSRLSEKAAVFETRKRKEKKIISPWFFFFNLCFFVLLFFLEYTEFHGGARNTTEIIPPGFGDMFKGGS